VYDFVIVDGEGDLDWLEIRLDGMGGHVDYFIIAEGALTGDGEGIVRRNWDRFERWQKKIVLFVLEEEPAGQRREDFQRNAMFLKAMSTIEGEKKPRRGDVLIIANVDEIVRPAALLVLRNCDFPKRVTLRSRLYYYGFQWLHRGEEWAYPQATTYQGGNTILPADLRNGDGGNRMVNWWDKADFWNAGWHCRFCFKTIEDMLDKMASLSDMGLNQEAFRNRMRIVDRVRKGLDLWDMESEGFERIEASDDIPEMVLKQRERFGYLLNRDGPNSGFVDMGAGELTAD
jgi:beta-1,4-mannosyl-glycoprotein beta-1,4-N-acetylglucosaminyltransferase